MKEVVLLIGAPSSSLERSRIVRELKEAPISEDTLLRLTSTNPMAVLGLT